MSVDGERLMVLVEARIADFERRMKAAEKRGTKTYNTLQNRSRGATRRMERDMVRSTTRVNRALASTSAQVGSVSRVLTGFAAGFAGAFSFAAITRGMRQVVSDLSALGKTARDVSMDVEELQAIQRGFAREARVSQDEVNASLERFNRRIGEAAHGAGPLNAVIERYGINLRDSNGQLKSQSELLREIAETIRRTTNDQERAAIAQAAFGDTGRRLAQVLAGGAEAMERIVDEGREAGLHAADMVSRAEELDDRFDDVAHTIRVAAQELSMMGFEVLLPLLDRLERLADRRSTLRDFFGTDDAALAALGSELFDKLNASRDLIQDYLRDLRDLSGAMGGLERQGESAADEIQRLSDRLIEMGEVDAARAVGSISEDMREAIREFQNGEKSADEFAATMGDLGREVDDVTGEIAGLDASTLNAIRAQFGGLIGLVELLTARVQDLKAEAGGVASDTPVSRRAALNDDQTASMRRREAALAQLRAFIAEQERQRSLNLEQIEIEREMDRVRRAAAEDGVRMTEAQIEAEARLNVARRAELRGGGGSGGGGASSPDEFMRAVDAIRDRTAALEAEAAALVLAAGSGREYGNAINYAMQRARLLHAAQQAGLQITPELEAAIDRLADAYARASDEAENMAGRLRDAQADAQAGAQAMTSLFEGIMEGSGGARRALSQLLAQIARVQMQRALLQAFPGFMSGLGGLLSFDRGGYTGHGARLEPAGVVHRGEYVFSKRAVKAIGLDRLDAMHQAANGYAGGGAVGGGGRGSGAQSGNSIIELRLSEGLVEAILQEAEDQSIKITRAGLTEFTRGALPQHVAAINKDPRRRG